MARRAIGLLTTLFVLGLSANAAFATTIVPPADLGELTRESRAVVLATCLGGEPTRQGLLILTQTDFAVERTVKGPITPGETIAVIAPGGEIGGLGVAVPGSPRFAAGGTYLLFLDSRPDGTWLPRLMAYGILQRISADGVRLLEPLPEAAGMAAVARSDGATPEAPGTYVEDPLLTMLSDIVGGRGRWDAARALVTPPEPVLHTESAPANCKFAGFRWFDFDTGGNISIDADQTGDSSLAGGGFTQVQDALGMWDGVSGTSLDLRYGGATSYTMSCSAGQDIPGQGDNIVVFNDPCSDIPDLTGCNGTLAFGGAWFSNANQTFDGQSWHPAISWFVVVNNDIGGCIGSANYRNMMAHELGHGLGFDHFTDSGSLMYFTCDGGSCNGINSTDIACADYFYPAQATSPPSAPTGVSATDGSFSDKVRVTWSSASGATSYEVFRNTSNDSGSAVSLGTTSSTTFDDTSATPGTTYWYWVQASNSAGTSGFSASDSGYAVVCTTPAAPEASAPSSAVSGSPYLVSWTATSADGTYYLQESTSPSFSGQTTTNFTSVTGTSKSFNHTVATGTDYYYRVRAKELCGGQTLYSDYSPAVQVTVQPSCSQPSAPAISAPATAQSGVTYSVTWTGTSPTGTYELDEAADPSFTAPTTYSVSATGRTFSHTVSDTTTFYYRVRATWNCQGTPYTSNNSATAAVAVQPPCPTPPAPTASVPAQASSGAGYSVVWSETSPISSYEVQEATDFLFSVPTTFAVTGTSRAFSHTVSSDTAFYYRVRALNTCGATQTQSTYSPAVTITVTPQCLAPGALTLVSPADGTAFPLGTTSVALIWQSSTGAGSYDLYFGTAASPPLFASGMTTTGLTVTTGPGNVYRWKVVAHAACNASLTSTSETRSFSVPAPIPPPAAAFTFTPPQPLTGDAIQFTDTSSGSPTQWSWAFGDGSTSAARNPSHAFAAAGSYTVTLTATNAGGSTSSSSTVTVRDPARTGVVAVVARVTGLGTSAWRSDVAVANPADQALPLELDYKVSGSATTIRRSITVPPHGSQWYSDVVATLFGAGDGRGSLVLVPPREGPAPAVFSRTYSMESIGNLGQGVPSVVPGEAGTVYLPGLFQNDVTRTNVGVTAGDHGVLATFTLLAGGAPATVTREISPFDQQQWSLATLFPQTAGNLDPVTVRVATDHPAVTYTSAVDQVSQDAALSLGVVPSTDLLIPIAAHNPGKDTTFWRTDIALHNPGNTPIAVRAEYLPAGHDNTSGGAAAVIATLAPGASKVVADVLGTSFGVTNDKGAVRLTAGGSAFAATSRTYTTRTEGGTLGQGVAALAAGAVSAADRAVTGIRTTGGTRTNIGFATVDTGAHVDLVMRNADGTVLATRTGFWIPPRTVVQLTYQDAFPGAGDPNPVGTLEVHPDAPVAVYLSVIDGSSQDPAFLVSP